MYTAECAGGYGQVDRGEGEGREVGQWAYAYVEYAGEARGGLNGKGGEFLKVIGWGDGPGFQLVGEICTVSEHTACHIIGQFYQMFSAESILGSQYSVSTSLNCLGYAKKDGIPNPIISDHISQNMPLQHIHTHLFSPILPFEKRPSYSTKYPNPSTIKSDKLHKATPFSPGYQTDSSLFLDTQKLLPIVEKD